MKIFKKIVIVLLAIIAVLVVIAFFLPSGFKVTRSITISAPDSVVYKLASNLNKWDIWTTWTPETDSTAVFVLEGEDGKPGTIRKWDGKILGNGEMVISSVKQNELMGYDLALDKGKFKSKGEILIEKTGDSVKVTWTHTGDLGYNPVSRYFGLTMDNMMGPDFEKGLSNLKKIAEERKEWPQIIETTLPEQTVLLICDSAGPETYGQILGKAYGEISHFIHSNKLKSAGAPFATYLKWDSVTMFSVMDIGIPVEKTDIQAKGRIRVETYPSQKVIMTRYFGPYEKTASYYYAMDKYMKQEKLTEAGGPMEIYVTDPMVEKDPMKVETDIIFPVK